VSVFNARNDADLHGVNAVRKTNNVVELAQSPVRADGRDNDTHLPLAKSAANVGKRWWRYHHANALSSTSRIMDASVPLVRNRQPDCSKIDLPLLDRKRT
jgi:hypothetical protein